MRKNLPIWIRTVSVTLLIAMVYYFAGYRLVYSFVMHNAKQDAAFAIQHKAIISAMALSGGEYSNLKWTEKNKEFCYKGELYDVVSIQKSSGNSYVLEVYEDKNETRWAKAMNDFVKFLFPAGHNKKNNTAEGLLSAFQKEYTPLQKAKVEYIPEAKSICYTDGKNCPSILLIKPIWHPPATC